MTIALVAGTVGVIGGGAAVGAGATALVGGVIKSKANSKASKAQVAAANAGIQERREARDDFNRRTQPFADAGLSTIDRIKELLGIDQPAPQQQQFNQPFVGPQQGQVPQQTQQAPAQGAEAAQAQAKIEQLTAMLGQVQTQGHGEALRQQIAEQQALISGQTQSPQQTQLGQEAPSPLNAVQPLDPRSSELERLLGLGQQPSFNEQIDEINPILSILREQGFTQIQEAAAARGALGAGGTLKDLTKFNTDLATLIVPQLQQQRSDQNQRQLGNLLNVRQLENQEKSQEFGNLFNLLGLGANVTVGQGTAGINAAAGISNLHQDIGTSKANRAIGKANVITEGIENVQESFGGGFGGFTPPPSFRGVNA